MPVAERGDEAPPKGQPRGQRIQQERFLQATQPAQTPVVGEPGQALPAAGQQAQPRFSGDPLEAILEPTSRPDEPITAGLEAFEQEDLESLRDWFPTFQALAQDPEAPAVIRDIAARASFLLEQ